jgi:hypothetical protein
MSAMVAVSRLKVVAHRVVNDRLNKKKNQIIFETLEIENILIFLKNVFEKFILLLGFRCASSCFKKIATTMPLGSLLALF